MPNNKQQGFSLLEILIAFSILALSLGILLKIFSAGVNTAIIAENYTTAVQISESLMAKTGIETPLQIGQTTGIENNIYHWQIEISPFTFNDDQIDTKTLPAELFKVKISVHWGDDMLSDRQLELTTLKLLNKSI
ncbi:MAG: type II secretion system protein [Methylococcales bacterium]